MKVVTSKCAVVLMLAVVGLALSTSSYATSLTLTCASGTGEVGVAYNSALVASGGVGPYTFSIAGGALPPGLTLDPSTGAITGTPASKGTFSYKAKVVDSAGNTATAKCKILVHGAVSLDCGTGTNKGVVGEPYSQGLKVYSGVGPYTYSIIAGSLPPGLTLNPSTGAITGIPTTAGRFFFTAQVVDALGAVGTTKCLITILPPLALSCPSSSGQVGIAYSSKLVASGGLPPYTFSIVGGSLPPGLTLDPSTGTITGTPTTPGTFNFTTQVTDSNRGGAGTATTNCSITIAPAPLQLNCASSTAQVGVPYSSALVATGGVPPYTYSIASGSLPPGLTLNPSTGAITGTPTQSGTFNYTAKAVDSTGASVTTNCSIVVAPAPLQLNCASSTAQVGVPYSSALVATGGVPPYTYSIVSGSLPPGLTLNASTGAITGTPMQSGTFNYTAKAVDSTGASVTTNCSIVVAPAPLQLNCASSTAQVGVPYSSALVATGGVPPYTYSIASGSLPPGLTLNASTGAITGTPTQSGTFNYTAKAVDSTGASVTTNCSIVVQPATLTLTCASSTGEVGLAYSSSVVATGGVTPYTFAIVSGSLPPGLTLNASTGAITGTPSSEGTFSFTVQVTDANGNTATASCAITIKTCGTTLTPITYNVSEGKGNVGQIAWFNSHLTQLQGQIPNSDFQLFITGGKIVLGSTTLTVPDAVITFSSKANCAQTTFNTTFSRWETTLPLSAAYQANEIFAAGLAYLIPNGFQGASSMTWSADISSTAPGIVATWEIAVSNWYTQNEGVQFPALNESPFVPDYNGMQVNAAYGECLCSGNSQDHAGAPEFYGREKLLVYQGHQPECGSGNWTGTFSPAPQPVQICQATGGGGGSSCLASSVNASIKPGTNFVGIGLQGTDFEMQGPLQVTGNLAIGANGFFHLSNDATLNSTLFADPSAWVQIDWGSELTGGTVTESLSAMQTAATNLSNWAAGLTPTQTFGDIKSSKTITGSGGQNVISVTGYFNLGYGSSLTVSGGTSDTFIFNIQNGMQLGDGSSITLSGVSPGQVLFNFPGGWWSGVQMQNANSAGIFLAPTSAIIVDGGTHNSEFISGVKLSVDCNQTTLTAPACSQ